MTEGDESTPKSKLDGLRQRSSSLESSTPSSRSETSSHRVKEEPVPHARNSSLPAKVGGVGLGFLERTASGLGLGALNESDEAAGSSRVSTESDMVVTPGRSHFDEDEAGREVAEGVFGDEWVVEENMGSKGQEMEVKEMCEKRDRLTAPGDETGKRDSGVMDPSGIRF